MEIDKAQADMRYAYYGGATGVMASAFVWLLAGVVAVTLTELASIIALYIAGMFIFPASVVVSKALGRPGTTIKGNTLSFLGLESTGILVFCYPIAYVVSTVHVEWFFPAMLILIGVRYLVFTTIYGRKIYWLFGFVLIAGGYIGAILHQPFHVGAFAGAFLEFAFGSYIFLSHRNESRENSTDA